MTLSFTVNEWKKKANSCSALLLNDVWQSPAFVNDFRCHILAWPLRGLPIMLVSLITRVQLHQGPLLVIISPCLAQQAVDKLWKYLRDDFKYTVTQLKSTITAFVWLVTGRLWSSGTRSEFVLCASHSFHFPLFTLLSSWESKFHPSLSFTKCLLWLTSVRLWFSGFHEWMMFDCLI